MEIKDKIQNMFMSSDRELWKLAQRMCHLYRIDYHLLVGVDAKIKKHIRISAYSLNPIRFPIIRERFDYYNLLSIKLNKHGNNTKDRRYV